MVTITIRDVPDAVRDELAGRAARSGRSLQEFLKGTLVDLSHRPDPAVLLVEVRERARTYPPVDPDSLIADVDAGRR